MNCLPGSISDPSNINCILIRLLIKSMNTSNSSKHRKGLSMASHKAIIKATVANDRSPPESERMFLVACSLLTLTCKPNAYKKCHTKQGLQLNQVYDYENQT